MPDTLTGNGRTGCAFAASSASSAVKYSRSAVRGQGERGHRNEGNVSVPTKSATDNGGPRWMHSPNKRTRVPYTMNNILISGKPRGDGELRARTTHTHTHTTRGNGTSGNHGGQQP